MRVLVCETLMLPSYRFITHNCECLLLLSWTYHLLLRPSLAGCPETKPVPKLKFRYRLHCSLSKPGHEPFCDTRSLLEEIVSMCSSMMSWLQGKRFMNMRS